MDSVLASGKIVFQEGKKLDGEYFVASVMVEAASKHYIFSLFDLQLEKEYRIYLSFADFEELFKFESSMLPPWNSDARYHWIIERLALVVEEYQGPKKLCIGEQPTSNNENVFNAADPIQSVLIRSESARSRFLESIMSRCTLEEAKSLQRLSMLDQHNMSQANQDDKTSQQANKHVEDVKRKLLEKQIRAVQRIQEEKKIAGLKPREKKPVRQKSFEASKSDEALSIPQSFIEAEMAKRAILKQRSIAISSRNAQIRMNFKEKVRSLAESRQKLWLKFQAEAAARREHLLASMKSSISLETLRATRIVEQEVRRRMSFSSTLLENRRLQALRSKQWLHRVKECKQRKFRDTIQRILREAQKKADRQKVEMIRNRNIEIKLELRDRRVKEEKWKRERQHVHADENIMNIPEPGSARTQKTITSAASLSKKEREEQVAIATERAEFIARLDREERIEKKISSKPHIDEPQPDRYLVWKQEEALKREARMQRKLDAEALKRNLARMQREKDITDYIHTRELESKRTQIWTQRETISNHRVVEIANANVALVDKLIPCLAI